MVEWFLALRFLQPRRSYVSVITILSLLGVMLSVMVLIVVLSVMEGFQKELQDKVIGFNAHLHVTNDGIIQNFKEVQKIILKDPRVAACTPFVLGPVLVEYNGRVSTPWIKGSLPEESEAVLPMKHALVQGKWLSEESEVLVGTEWARKHQAAVGDVIMIHSPRNLENLRNRPEQGQSFYLPSEYRIAGIFSTGMFEYDYNFLLVHLHEAQRLYNLDDGVHTIAVRLRHADDAIAVRDALNRALPKPLHAVTWMEQNKQLFSAIQVEKVAMSFCLFFIMLVAAFGICSTLITITVQKTKEIGMLKALGARDTQVAGIFTLYGVIVGILGSFLGVIAGLLALYYRNDFRDWLARVLGIELFPAAIYNFPQIPAVVDWSFIALVALAGVVLSTLAALIPAWMAAQADPVQSLRGDV